jgi:hypothetical protein
MLIFWLSMPIVFQGIIMTVDEFYFHHKRGLPLWEKIGHPLDSLTILICYSFLVLKIPIELNIKIYIGLSLFSCLFVTKDEFIHTENCEASENWLHSLLFILHPISLLAAGFIWIKQISPIFIKAQLLIVFIFMFYQIIFWGFRGKSK